MIVEIWYCYHCKCSASLENFGLGSQSIYHLLPQVLYDKLELRIYLCIVSMSLR